MARVRMVTRTVYATVCECLCMNTDTAEVIKKEFILTGDVDAKDRLKLLKKTYEKDSLVIAKIIAVRTEETLYGMPETDFIKLAKVLPPRGTKEE